MKRKKLALFSPGARRTAKGSGVRSSEDAGQVPGAPRPPRVPEPQAARQPRTVARARNARGEGLSPGPRPPRRSPPPGHPEASLTPQGRHRVPAESGGAAAAQQQQPEQEQEAAGQEPQPHRRHGPGAAPARGRPAPIRPEPAALPWGGQSGDPTPAAKEGRPRGRPAGSPREAAGGVRWRSRREVLLVQLGPPAHVRAVDSSGQNTL